MDTGLTYFTLVGAALALSFLFSGMEAGVAALSRVRIRNLQRQGSDRLRDDAYRSIDGRDAQSRLRVDGNTG